MGPYWIDRLERLLAEHQPTIIAISCKWWDTLFGAVELARLIRRRAPSVTLVAGGQTATYFARHLVQKTEFDVVIRGDGELPLLELAKGTPSCNMVFKNLTEYPTTYVQQSGEDLRLYHDLTEIADETMLRAIGYDAPFIWTGKGCKLTCLYCAGSALGHKKLFGRKGYMYRPVEQVLHDMEVLAPWSDGAFLFDFDPVGNPEKASYYAEIFEQLPQQQYHTYFYCWTLPDAEFVDRIASTFQSAFVSLDAQAYSEPHRQRLAEKRMIKPYRSDRDFEATIAQIASYRHMDAGIYGIIGLAGETRQDVDNTEQWIAHLLNTYGDGLGELAVTPLATEPGSLVNRNPAKYGMRLLRETFEDYLEFTRLKYFGTDGIHDQAYDPNLPHPYGVYDSNDQPGRVYHDYQRINNRIHQTFYERREMQFNQSLQSEGDTLTLSLHNRNQTRAVWDLIIRACGMAQKNGQKHLHINAKNAFITVPDLEVFKLTGTHDYTLNRLPGLKRAIDARQLVVTVSAREEQKWGAFDALGLRLNFGTDIVKAA
ncbi:hypothetical protein AB833_28715 [Chromatiales bacterium (ex Bugula neritina AB1)]|nr:hypothetical protein AB833_28715 [Chromatiales bacterium (ex Bugula neritina AB1)]